MTETAVAASTKNQGYAGFAEYRMPPTTEAIITGMVMKNPMPGPPVPPPAAPIKTEPLPKADITLPLDSLGTMSAISAELAGMKKTVATATAMRMRRISMNLVE